MITRHFIKNKTTTIPDNEIWYTSNDGNVVTPYDTKVFGAKIVSNTYEDGKGVIKFDNSVTSMGTSVFFNCKSLTSVTIPNSVTHIRNDAFDRCLYITSINIPNSVTSIESQIFAHCSYLTSITYNGTKEQWNDITKSDFWDLYSVITYVHCTNGIITL